MRPALLCLLLLAAPARAWFWNPMKETLAKPKSLYEAGKYPEVVAALTPESLQKLDHVYLQQAYLYLGTSYQRMGKLSEALSTFQLACKIFPKDINLLSELAGILHQAGLDEQAEPLFEKVVSIHPNNARGLLGLAEIYRSLGLLDSSADYYERALETMPDQAPLWRDYAEVLLAQRDTLTAGLAIRKSLSIAADPDSSVDLGFIERAAGRLDSGIAALEEALKAAPSRTDIALTRGLWLLEAGRYADAAAVAKARLAADPEDPLALWIAARVSLRDDHLNEARKDLRAAANATRRSPFVARAAKALLARLESK